MKNGQALGVSNSNRRPAGRLPVQIPIGGVRLSADLCIPDDPRGIVLFAHGSGSSRLSPRNQYVAGVLQKSGMATLLLDLLTDAEALVDEQTKYLRFDIPMLTSRLHGAALWLLQKPELENLRLGVFGASTGAAAALLLAAHMKEVCAVVSRGGRPDLTGPALTRVHAPVLLIVGGNDQTVLELNRDAMARIPAQKKLEIVHGATHLFEESGALERVAQLARGWFERHLATERIASRAA